MRSAPHPFRVPYEKDVAQQASKSGRPAEEQREEKSSRYNPKLVSPFLRGPITMNAALDTLSIAVSSILSSAMVTAVVQIFLEERADVRLEKLRNDLEKEKAAREESARRTSEQLKTQFSWLYTQRAQVMNEIYGCILEAEEAIQECIPPLAGWGLAAERASGFGNSKSHEERVRAAMEICERFERTIKKNQLVFSSELAGKLRGLVAAYDSINFELDEPQGPVMWLGDSPAIMNGQRKAHEILGQIEREFRALYGSLTESQVHEGHQESLNQ
jgi:hypothetical protein